jgi:hypothetical protein
VPSKLAVPVAIEKEVSAAIAVLVIWGITEMSYILRDWIGKLSFFEGISIPLGLLLLLEEKLKIVKQKNIVLINGF